MVEKLSVKQKPILRGEAALAVAVIVNTFGVVLMLYSESGISAISSVPFAFSLVLPQLTLGTWTYLFQGVLVLSLMLMRKQMCIRDRCTSGCGAERCQGKRLCRHLNHERF